MLSPKKKYGKMEIQEDELERFINIFKRCESFFLAIQKGISCLIAGLLNSDKYFKNYASVISNCSSSVSSYTNESKSSQKFYEMMSEEDRFLVNTTIKLNDLFSKINLHVNNSYLINIQKLLFQYNSNFKSLQKKTLLLFKQLKKDLSVLRKRKKSACTAFQTFKSSIVSYEEKNLKKYKISDLEEISNSEKSKLDQGIRKRQKRLEGPIFSYQQVLTTTNVKILNLYEVLLEAVEFYDKLILESNKRKVLFKKVYEDVELSFSSLIKSFDVNENQSFLDNENMCNNLKNGIDNCSNEEINKPKNLSKKNSEENPNIKRTGKLNFPKELIEFEDILINKYILQNDLPVNPNQISNLRSRRSLNSHFDTIHMKKMSFQAKNQNSCLDENEDYSLEEKVKQATVVISKSEDLQILMEKAELSVNGSKDFNENIKEEEPNTELTHLNLNRPLIRRPRRSKFN